MCRAYNLALRGEHYLVRADQPQHIIEALGDEASQEATIVAHDSVVPCRMDYDFCLPEEADILIHAVATKGSTQKPG